MNRWVTNEIEYSACISIVNKLINTEESLPNFIARPGVKVIGFADECFVRQEGQSFESLRKFLASIDEKSFYFNWLEFDATEFKSRHGIYPSFYCDIEETVFGSDHIKIQNSIPPSEALYSDEWAITGMSNKWAIYGEHYNSEICVFLCKDVGTIKLMYEAFSFLTTNPIEVSKNIWVDVDNVESREFRSEFLRNYSVKGE